MVPSTEILQSAVEAAVAKHPESKYLSVMEVNQFVPRNQGYVIPSRSTLVADAIKAVFPQAQDIGGGVFQVKK